MTSVAFSERRRVGESRVKAARPEKYRENYKMELTGRDGGPIQSQVAHATPSTMLTDEELERIITASLSDDDQAPTDPALPAVAPGQLRIAGPDKKRLLIQPSSTTAPTTNRTKLDGSGTGAKAK